MEYTEFVTGQTLVGDIVRDYPVAVQLLMSVGMHCIGCPSSQAESLSDACAVHGIEVEPVIRALNLRIAAAKEKGEVR